MSEVTYNEELLSPNTQTKFSDFDIPDFLITSLEKGGITNPSPVQEKAIPIGLLGQDILASAQTGTGKTIAFLLPIITRMLQEPESNALILAPTRELAVQVKEAAFKLLPRDGGLKVISLIGGESITKQFFDLKSFENGAVRKKPQNTGKFVRGRRDNFERATGGDGTHSGLIVVGTPGRIKDHKDRGNLKLDKTHFVVLDETDRMLDLGFKDVLEEIFETLPQKRQTLMFSATMPSKIVSMSRTYLTNPARVDIEKKPENAPKITQNIIKYSYSQKFNVLKKLLNEKEGTSIIFVKTKMGAEELSAKLEAEGIEARAIHGDLKQRERDYVIKAFKLGKMKVMVATDVAARGLHIPHISRVVNYDLPQCKEDYIHRIGRTGRAGEEGEAFAFVNEDDRREEKVAIAYTKTNNSLDDEDEDVKAFGASYAGKKKRSSFGARNFGGKRDFASRGFEGRSFEGRRGGEGFNGGGNRESFGGGQSRDGFGGGQNRERRQSRDRNEGSSSQGRSRDGEEKRGFFGRKKY